MDAFWTLQNSRETSDPELWRGIDSRGRVVERDMGGAGDVAYDLAARSSQKREPARVYMTREQKRELLAALRKDFREEDTAGSRERPARMQRQRRPLREGVKADDGPSDDGSDPADSDASSSDRYTRSEKPMPEDSPVIHSRGP